MATDVQIKNFQETEHGREMATIMTAVIYPRIILLLKQLGMNEVRLEEIAGLKRACITVEHKIEFFNLEKDGKKERKKDIYTIDFFGKNLCPYFLKETNSVTEEHESIAEKYSQFCKVVMNAIPPLELKLKQFNENLEIARSFTIPLTRQVIIEKYNGKKKK